VSYQEVNKQIQLLKTKIKQNLILGFCQHVSLFINTFMKKYRYWYRYWKSKKYRYKHRYWKSI